MCRVDGSPGVVGRGNSSVDGPYGVYPCYKKSLGMQLSIIVIKLEKLHTYSKSSMFAINISKID
jgi:hypothetical protein